MISMPSPPLFSFADTMRREAGRLAVLAVGAVLVGVIGTVVTGCGRTFEDGSARSEPDEIRLGILSDTGSFAGPLALKAARLAVAEVNDAGGLLVEGVKRSVRLVVAEAGGTPEGGFGAALELVNQQQVAAIVGSNFSQVALPASEAAEKARVPIVHPGATHPDVTGDRRFAFRVTFTDPVQGKAMAQFARQRLAAKTAAIYYDAANEYSRSVAGAFRDVFESLGGTVVVEKGYPTGETDHGPVFERIRDERPDVILLPNYNSASREQATTARRLGIEAVLLGTDGWMPELMRDFTLVDGSYVTQAWHPDLAKEAGSVRDFIDLFEAAYGEAPDAIAAQTFDACGLIFEAIRRAGSIDPAAIRDALAAIEDYPGVTGSITYRGVGNDPHRPVAIVKLRAGRLALAEQVELSKAENGV